MTQLMDTWQEPLFTNERSRTVVVVDLACLACGRGRQVIVAALADLPPMPERCTVCGGSVLAVGSTTRVVRYAGPIDWYDGLPKRGRPLAHPRIEQAEGSDDGSR